MKRSAALLIIMAALLTIPFFPGWAPQPGSYPHYAVSALPPQVLPPPEPALPLSKTNYDRVPILMYHVIEDYSGVYEQLYTSPEFFRSQLVFLKEQGFTTVTVQDTIDHWAGSKPLPDRPIVLTFDDGYRSIYTQAYPIMKELGIVGTLYLHSNKIDTNGGLTREMITEMHDYGMEIGSHTLSHTDLTKLSKAKMIKEITESKRILESITGTKVTTFAYPAGRFNSTVIKAVKDGGYQGAVTTKYAVASKKGNMYTLSRLRINKSDGIKGFKSKISRII